MPTSFAAHYSIALSSSIETLAQTSLIGCRQHYKAAISICSKAGNLIVQVVVYIDGVRVGEALASEETPHHIIHRLCELDLAVSELEQPAQQKGVGFRLRLPTLFQGKHEVRLRQVEANPLCSGVDAVWTDTAKSTSCLLHLQQLPCIHSALLRYQHALRESSPSVLLAMQVRAFVKNKDGLAKQELNQSPLPFVESAAQPGTNTNLTL